LISIGDALLKLGIDKGNFDRDMAGIGDSIKKHQKAIGIGMVAVGTAIVGMATASVVAFAKAGDEVAKMAKRTGFSTEALSELKHAADLSGASLAGLEKASRTLAGAILDAGYGLETYVRSFDQLGLSYENLKGLKPEDQFMAVMEALAGVEDESARAALATDLFGRAGTQLLPMLADGTEGLASMRQEAHDLGIVFDAEAAKSAENFTDAMTRVKASLQGAMFAIADSLMPVIQPLIDKVTELVTIFGKWAKENEGLTKIIVGAGGLLIGLGGLLLILPKLQLAVQVLGTVLKTLLLNPIVLLIGAIAMLGYGIYALIKHHTDWNAVVEASEKVNEELAKSEGKLTKEVLEAQKAYNELRIGYGQLEPEELKALERSQELIAQWESGVYVLNEATGALELYDAGLDNTTKSTEELRKANERLTGSLRGSAAAAFMTYAGMGVITAAQFAQQKALGRSLGIPGYAGGGIITKPTLAMLGEKGPEAVVPLGRGMPGQMMTIIYEVDGRQMARTVMPYAVGELRLRGVKL